MVPIDWAIIALMGLGLFVMYRHGCQVGYERGHRRGYECNEEWHKSLWVSAEERNSFGGDKSIKR